MRFGPRRLFLATVAVPTVLLAGCGPVLVPLRVAQQPAGRPLQGLEVIASLAGGVDPLPVSGSRLVYAGLTDVTGQIVEAATAPWAARHRALRPGGWQLLVEITRAGAGAQAGMLTVEIETRVTLRGTVGQVHLGQTHGYCRVADPLAGDGSRVVTTCLERMARDLSGWLEGQPA